MNDEELISDNPKVLMLSTIDNPFNPFEKFDEWFNWDSTKGYNCCGMVARLCYGKTGITEAENRRIANKAVQRIVEIDPTGFYIAVEGHEDPGGGG